MLKEAVPATAVETVLSGDKLLKKLPAAVYATDAKGRITFFNDAIVRFAGRTPTLGETWHSIWQLCQPDGTPLPADQCPMAIALREHRPVRGISVIAQRPDGTRVSFMPYPTPLFDDNDTLIGSINVLMDLSDPHDAPSSSAAAKRQDATKEGVNKPGQSERDFELLVRSVTDYAIFMLDTTGHVISWNSGAEKIKGYSADDIVGSHFSRFYTPEDQAAGIPQHALSTALREGRYESEGWRVRKDGTRFWANVVIDPVWNNGVFVGFAKVTRDATTRRHAELALFESERRFRGIVNTALDAFAQIDEAGRITEWNPQARDLFGWTREQVLGKPLANLCLAADDSATSSWLASAWHERSTRKIHQITAVNRAGRRFTAELSASVLPLASGPLMNIFVRDLTEKMLMETQLRQSQKMEALGQLTGGIAHDFNNILQAISASLEVVEMISQREGFTAADKHIHNALCSVRRAAGLTHRLLAFARR
ncbi:MAG TPA: PAS domain S-box protein [Dyella sp.]|nr:PAS domain S-box protein [Dyella sp.]